MRILSFCCGSRSLICVLVLSRKCSKTRSCYLLRVASVQNSTILNRTVDVRLSLDVAQSDATVTFTVADVSLDSTQEVKAEKLQELDLPSHVSLPGGHKVLAALKGKEIVYHAGEMPCKLKFDKTKDNKVIGPVAPVLSLLIPCLQHQPNKTFSLMGSFMQIAERHEAMVDGVRIRLAVCNQDKESVREKAAPLISSYVLTAHRESRLIGGAALAAGASGHVFVEFTGRNRAVWRRTFDRFAAEPARFLESLDGQRLFVPQNH